jgi:hypothetical protein
VPTQIDFGDYRDTDGVEVPFRRVMAQPGRNSVIQLEQVQQNAPINDDKFVKPSSPSAPLKPATH